MQAPDRNAQWADERSDLITASDVARLLCEGYASSEQERLQQRAQLVMEKAGLAERWEGNETTDLATFLEAGVIEAARARFGWDIRPHGKLLTDPDCPRLGATPDSTLQTPWGLAVVNVKVSAASAQEDCKPKKDGSPSGASFANGCPLYYQLQLQAEMAVTGYRHAGLLVLHHSQREGLKLRGYHVPRHEKSIARIRFEVMRAWRDIQALREGRLTA